MPIAQPDPRRAAAEAALIKAGLALVARCGFEAFTLEAVAGQAGYSRGLPRYYFGSKPGFVDALVADWERRSMAAIEARSARPATLETILGIAAEFLDKSVEDDVRFVAMLVSAAHTRPALAARLATINAAAMAMIEAHLIGAQKSGEVADSVQCRAQAAIILATLRGLLTLWSLDPDRLSLSAIRKELLTSLEVSLQPANDSPAASQSA